MENKNVQIDIGCGKNRHKGFVGIDIDKEVNPDIVASALDLPFQNDSVDEVVSTHLVEHFIPEDAQQFFTEIYRVLKEGGEAKIKVDKDWYKKRLMAKDPTHKYRYTEKELLNMVTNFSKKEVIDKIYFLHFYQPRRKIFISLVK
ncbi:MAG TPA: class I SAM-dependent methyltransferase [Ignavibacteria bacterium]|nr:class I SAM-dependent methyltransferase [Ignavibacteria bacterium]